MVNLFIFMFNTESTNVSQRLTVWMIVGVPKYPLAVLLPRQIETLEIIYVPDNRPRQTSQRDVVL